MALRDEDVSEILRIIDSAELDELSLETPAFSLHVVRRPAAPGAPPPKVPAAAAQAAAADQAPAADRPAAHAGPASAGATREIEAPMLGTFYRSPAPGEASFVEVGSTVEPDTIVCIIEVMKMMNSVHAGVAGTITEICVENGEPVEYGARLFRVEP